MKTRIFTISVFLLLFISQISFSQSGVVIKLSPSTGQDCMLFSNFRTTPLPNHQDMVSTAWTVQGEFIIGRALFKYNLTEVPPNTNIVRAKLSLFANPNPSNSPHSGRNECYIRRVTSPWDAQTVMWETQPDFSTADQILLPESTYPTQDYHEIDVTALVRDMILNPSTNYGFMLMLRIESTYRSMNFASGDCIDINKRPQLNIVWGRVGIEPITSSVPVEFNLFQNFPNPFNPSTNIKFDLPKSSFTTLKVFNELGKEVSTLLNENLNPGSYEVKWDGSNFGSGAYFIRIESGSNIVTKRMMLIK